MAAAKKAVKATSEQEIIIPAIDIRTASIKIVGDSPLIMHKWAEKAKKEMLDKQMKVAKTKAHDKKDPFEDFISSMYWLEGEPEEPTPEAFEKALRNGARFGFPATAVKAAGVSAAYRADLIKNKVSANGAFHIDGEFVEIHGVPQIREDMVKIGMGTADIRYRGEFPEWWSVFTIHYNAAVFSLEQIINMINLGGFACGIGEWRAEKGGTFGMYHVV